LSNRLFYNFIFLLNGGPSAKGMFFSCIIESGALVTVNFETLKEANSRRKGKCAVIHVDIRAPPKPSFQK
jgi:hypothetical protein